MQLLAEGATKRFPKWHFHLAFTLTKIVLSNQPAQPQMGNGGVGELALLGVASGGCPPSTCPRTGWD